jgi:L-alanine-DL-glutamate epimerase-like enolase superfamily enzyme
MKINSIRSQVVRLPVDEPLADGPPSGRAHNMFVTVRIETTDGIEGIGATFFGGVLSATLKQAIDQLGAMIVGEDPLRIDALTQKLRAAAASAGPGGILTLAISGIDMALWDIKGIFASPRRYARRPARLVPPSPAARWPGAIRRSSPLCARQLSAASNK